MFSVLKRYVELKDFDIGILVDEIWEFREVFSGGK